MGYRDERSNQGIGQSESYRFAKVGVNFHIRTKIDVYLSRVTLPEKCCSSFSGFLKVAS